MLDQIKKRGRPLGYKLSDKSKAAIAKAKTGGTLSEETKEKISKTLLAYFKNLHPLSKDIYESYQDVIDNNPSAKNWYHNSVESLNSYNNVVTERSLNAKRMRELSIELNISMVDNINMSDEMFVVNPEAMCELKILCESKGLTVTEALILIETDIDKFSELFKDYICQ